MRFSFLISIFAFMAATAGHSVYFYCVATSGHGYEMVPNITNYGVEAFKINVNLNIKLGENYTPYTVNSKDMTINQFSSTWGMANPLVYFVFPKQPADGKALALKLRDQCKAIIDAQNFPDRFFKQVRVSESWLSGSNVMTPGHPAVFLTYPPNNNFANIHRIDDQLQP